MIVDSSVAAAICLGEPGAEAFVDALSDAPRPRMSAGTYLEAAIVLDARRPGTFDQFITALGIEIVPFTAEQASIARDAYRRYGRGSGHAAGLNLGDCFSYALARADQTPLAYTGDDFSHTDIESAFTG